MAFWRFIFRALIFVLIAFLLVSVFAALYNFAQGEIGSLIGNVEQSINSLIDSIADTFGLEVTK